MREPNEEVEYLLCVASTIRQHRQCSPLFIIPNMTHENTVALGALTMANDGAVGCVDVITFVIGSGQCVSDHRECGCGNELPTTHYCKMSLIDGSYCIEGNENARICDVHAVCIFCQEK
jgi:hypothetical protein